MGVAERERGKKSQEDSLVSALPNMALDPMTLRSRPEPKPRAGHLTSGDTLVPLGLHFKNTGKLGYIQKRNQEGRGGGAWRAFANHEGAEVFRVKKRRSRMGNMRADL